MRNCISMDLIGRLTVSMAGSIAVLGVVVCRAQTAPSAPSDRMVAAGSPAATHTATRVRTLSSILATMNRTSGATILADSSVADEKVAQPAETTPDNFADQIAAIVKALPQGTTWAKVYLPNPTGRRLDADAVSDYVFAQARLFGGVGAAGPAGTVEIMGQKVPQEKAAPVIDALSLKPVYLITNPSAKTARATLASTGGDPNWSALSAEERQQAARQQAQMLLNLDPASRQAFLQQQQEVMRALFQQMSPEQLQQYRQSLGSNGRRPGAGRPNQ